MTELERAIRTFERNVRNIETALKGDTSGYVHVWPNHWLAIKIDGEDCRAVHVVNATVVSVRDKRKFFNGMKQRATLMPREKALCGALVHAVEMLETFQSIETKEIA